MCRGVVAVVFSNKIGGGKIEMQIEIFVVNAVQIGRVVEKFPFLSRRRRFEPAKSCQLVVLGRIGRDHSFCPFPAVLA
ncbi:hypothetical protein D3C87_1728910 [compost metagenome]